MIKIIIAFFTAFILLMQVAQAQQQGPRTYTCRAGNFIWGFGGSIIKNMRVQQGKTCLKTLNTGSSGYYYFEKMEIIKKPKNGFAGIKGYQIIFEANKNYVGKDDFTFRIHYLHFNKKNHTDVTYNVKISEGRIP